MLDLSQLMILEIEDFNLKQESNLNELKTGSKCVVKAIALAV